MRFRALLAVCVALAAAGCHQEPARFVPVSGRVTYDDGTLIPGSRLVVRFVPTAIEQPGATAEVVMENGQFHVATSESYGDGIARGKHKVLLMAFGDDTQLSRAVPAAYGSLEETPLLVDAADAPFHFRVHKPGSPEAKRLARKPREQGVVPTRGGSPQPTRPPVRRPRGDDEPPPDDTPPDETVPVE